MSISEDGKQLADEHWAYVESVIRAEWKAFATTTDCSPDLVDEHCEIIGHHYRSAMIHGFKHGVDAAEANGWGSANLDECWEALRTVRTLVASRGSEGLPPTEVLAWVEEGIVSAALGVRDRQRDESIVWILNNMFPPGSPAPAEAIG